MVSQHEHTPTSCTEWFFTMDTLLPVTPNVSLACTHSYQLYQKGLPERTRSIPATSMGLSAWTLFYKLYQRVSQHEHTPTSCTKWFLSMNTLLPAAPMVSQHEHTPTSYTKWFLSMNTLLPAVPNGSSPWTHSYWLHQMFP
jgi:hypothetical protein